ncbi:MAG: L-rhamnose isomerase [Planctomycetes bacterium GWF2_50_10]|nr:MAG: L-rhamnose isomerase [Planctomycetes bacterium GWF2_50_10]
MTTSNNERVIQNSYAAAREQYSAMGVDTEVALKNLQKVAISLHCWQGDDVGGFEKPAALLSGGGIQATGNYPGKARSIDELRGDISKVLTFVPGRHRLNLHACYLDNGGTYIDRDKIEPRHFQSWIDWAKANKLGLDFNPTFFSHEKAADGFTLSHNDNGIRQFWVDHGIACRKIAQAMGQQLNSPCVTNFWIPDGYKDMPVDRMAPRLRLLKSLDAIFAKNIDSGHSLDAVESKLFGIGAESYTVGSHEFYMGYAVSRQKLICLDAGHFHPTETISDKLSSMLAFLPGVLLHVSRPVRWDSDHVVILNDELQMIAQEIVRSGQIEKIHIGLDYFDASINRIAAWVIGSRALLKALMIAFLEPFEELKKLEADGDHTSRLAMLEELKTLPFGAVWDHYCLVNNVPSGASWIEDVKAYEKAILSKRC